MQNKGENIMSINVKILSFEINPSRYECCVRLLIDKLRKINCYVPLVTNKEPSSTNNEIYVLNQTTDEELTLRINDEIKTNFKVVFVTEYELLYENCISNYEQPIQGSSHTIFIADVINIYDEYTLICSVNGLDENISVELESKISNLKTGDKIKFKGEISLYII
jgi:hypothetical protein